MCKERSIEPKNLIKNFSPHSLSNVFAVCVCVFDSTFGFDNTVTPNVFQLTKIHLT